MSWRGANDQQIPFLLGTSVQRWLPRWLQEEESKSADRGDHLLANPKEVLEKPWSVLEKDRTWMLVRCKADVVAA